MLFMVTYSSEAAFTPLVKVSFGDVQLVLQQIVYDLDHTFHGRGFLADQAAPGRAWSQAELKKRGPSSCWSELRS